MITEAELKIHCRYVLPDGSFTYAGVPLAMCRDPLLGQSDVAVMIAILPWLCDRTAGWVTLGNITAISSMSKRTVQRSISRLVRAGWLGTVRANDNATRRKFVALWRTPLGLAKLKERLFAIPFDEEELGDETQELPPDRPNYRTYMRSERWRGKRERALKRALGRCQVCNEEKLLQVHHRTYARLGHERASDLIALCEDCHKIYHDSKKLAEEPTDDLE